MHNPKINGKDAGTEVKRTITTTRVGQLMVGTKMQELEAQGLLAVGKPLPMLGNNSNPVS